MDYIVIGNVKAVFGNKGEIKINVSTDFPEERFRIGENLKILDKKEKVIEKEIENSWQHNKDLIIKLKNVDSISQAEEFVNFKIVINKDDIHPLPSDVYYIHQIIGLKVYKLSGDYLGEITNCFQTGSNDVYIVENSSKEILLPALKEVIKKVDLNKKEMIVDLPPEERKY
ncbi:16S rRNA processing protein RimM [Candidatus Desantisbacteria bacterium]|nr:16S rRNA processing protein RimM [Candidatus Desantisbacteria bacterium]